MSAGNEVEIGRVLYQARVAGLGGMPMTGVDAEGLDLSIRRLFALLRERQVDYLLVGGVAMLQYVGGRNTEDIDVILALSALSRVPEISISSQELYFARGNYEAVKIDVLLTRNRVFALVLRDHAATCQFAGTEVRCATVEGLLLLKLYALPSLYRQGSFSRVGLYENDIATLVQAYGVDVELLLGELKEYMSETDLGALGDILTDIRGRLDRFGRGQQDGVSREG